MNMLDLMNKMTQLGEAKEKTKTGLKHTAEPGGYGRKDDEDDEGNKVKSTAAKKGKGRPKKDADDSGETKKYDFSAFGVKSGKDVNLPKHDKKKTTVVKGKSQSHADNKKDDGTDPEEHKTKAKKKGLKEYFDSLDQAMLAENEMSPDAIAKMNPQHKEYFGKNPHFTRGAEVKSVGKTINAKGNPISALATKVTPKFNKPGQVQRISKGSFNSPVEEAEQIQVKPASQMPKQPGQMTPPGQQQQQTAGQPAQNTQVIAQGNKTLGTVNNPQLAQQIKQSISKGEMTLMPDQQVNELSPGTIQSAAAKRDAQQPGQMSQATQRKDPMTHMTNRINMNNRPLKDMDETINGALVGAGLGALAGGGMGAAVGGGLGHIVSDIAGDNDATEQTTRPLKEKDIGKHNNATTGFDALVKKLTPKYGVEAAKRIAGAQLKKIREADQPPNDSLLSPMSEARAKADDKAEKAGKKVAKDIEYDEGHKGKDDNKAEKAGKKVTKDIEYDEKKKLPSMAHIKKMCQDGKSVAEICKMHPDCDQKELKQMVADCKKTLDESKGDGNLANNAKPYDKVTRGDVIAGRLGKDEKGGKNKNDLTKKKVKEGMDHRLKAARHMGKAHALTKEGYNCRYDDMEESRHYHEGYKEGLDECYGQMPIQGYVGEANNEVADMASYGAHTPTMEDDMYEMDKTSYMKQQAIKTPGDTFKAFGQTFKDKEVVESPFAFEAWEKELNSILEGKDVTEGMTVSISKGQQGTPDSVSVSAQDSEADQLLGIIKSAGLGLFGGDDAGQPQATQPMTVDVDGGEGPQANIEVVDDHDDMLSLIRKMTGQGPAQAAGDYEEEGGHEDHGHDHGEEETCESCGGMMEEGHSCGESVEEDESMDQREYEVAEEIDPNNNDEAEEEQTDATRDAALATAAGKNFANTDSPIEEGGDGGEASEEPEEELEESLANGADDTFESDIDFMTKVISGGLNKQKSTGQTTIPVVSTQVNRLGNPMRESTDLLKDWRKLSGIK